MRQRVTGAGDEPMTEIRDVEISLAACFRLARERARLEREHKCADGSDPGKEALSAASDAPREDGLARQQDD